MSISGIILGIVLIVIVWRLVKRVQLVRAVNRIPGPITIFPYGNALDSMTTPYQDLDRMMKNQFAEFRHQSVSRFWTFTHPTIMVLKASAAELILRSSTDLTKSKAYLVLSSWLGQGLLTSTGRKWTSDRKLLTPSFHFQILNTFMEIFNEKSLILVDKLSKHGSSGQAFDIFPYLTLCTLDVICDAAMGKNINAQNQKDSAYVRAIVTMSEVIAKRLSFPWLTIPWVYYFTDWRRKELHCLNIMHAFTNQVISERKADRKLERMKSPGHREGRVKEVEQAMGSKTRTRFLDMLLDISETDGRMTDREIREQVDTFMFEGHDTTACGLNWTIYFLGRHQTVQHKVYQELEHIFSNDEADRAVTSADLHRMKYMEAVIKESMRMVPVVPIFGRRIDSSLTIDGYEIPAGTDAMILPNYIHKDPDVYDRPDTFDPQRFLDDNKLGRHPYGFLGFSAGPRNCIGQKFALMEEKVVLCHLLRRYRIVSVDELDDIRMGTSLVAKPLNGMHVQLHLRTHHHTTTHNH